MKRALLIPAFLLACTADTSWASTENEFLDLDLSQLMQVKVTSVTKKPQELADSAAAVFVISNEDIRRSGVTSIPEALRMAPGLQVARISSNKWAITSRGFNGFFANKLLVLMDGRSIYTPAFSGVYWDSQDYLLEDIDRIEVIRGPGATMWGANAVNGVINIITKKTTETTGGLISLGGGNQEKAMAGLRYGSQINESMAGRVYLKMNDRASSELSSSGQDGGDAWTTCQGGFRIDGDNGTEKWTMQGDLHQGDNNQHLINLSLIQPPWIYSNDDNYDTLGWNMLGRWNHDFSADNATTLQIYYDVVERQEFYLNQDHNTFDLDFQHQLRLGSNDLIWGLAFRSTCSDFTKTITVNSTTSQVSFSPSTLHHDLYSGFLQDEISLNASIFLTLGSKIEHNDFTGIEVQPSARLLWQINNQQRLWGAVSRAVRTPSQIEQYGTMTTYVIPGMPPTVATLGSNEQYDSEEVIAYELGYRFSPRASFCLDLATYYNEYEKLRSYSASPYRNFTNNMYGSNHGVELASTWQAQYWLSLQLAYTYTKNNFHLDSTEDLSSAPVAKGSSPAHQLSLRTALDLNDQTHCDFWLRYVDKLNVASVNAWSNDWVVNDYVELDISLSWQISQQLKAQLVGQNLLNSSHLEFIQESFTARTELKRSIYAKINWDF